MAFGNSPYSYQQYMSGGNQLQQMGQYGTGQMGQQMNYGQQNMQMQTQYIKGRPVSGIEEARAAMIDLDGSIFVFPDISNKRMFTKQIMLDGSAEIKTYILEEETEEEKEEKPKSTNKKYVLKSEYDKSLKNLNNQIKRLTEMIGGMKDENEPDADV